MTNTESEELTQQTASWQTIYPDEEYRKRIRARFRELYEAAGKPEGVALYEAVDSGGFYNATCLNPKAAYLFPKLLSEFPGWHATPHRTATIWGLAEGDERLRNR